MAVTLTTPIAWLTATGDDAAMLSALQPNIVKGHTRDVLTALFLKFLDRGEAKSLLHELAADGIAAPLMKSAKKHLEEVAAFKKLGTPGTAYVGVGLTRRGYDALGVPQASQLADPAFRRGMANNATRQILSDPDVDSWDGPFRQEIHAIILVGDDAVGPHDKALGRVRTMIAARKSIVVLGQQEGLGRRNNRGDGIEHFGYVDGRSQPLFLTEDVAEEKAGGGTTNWNPAFGLARVIVPDPAAPSPATQFGSYFIFRKLEQNVQRFKRKEEKLADDLKLVGADEERAGAMVVGRFEDGTPLTMQVHDGLNPVPNDFNYSGDAAGAKCPVFGHIRKMNPRGSGGFEAEKDERLHVMARRGLPFGVRSDDPNDGKLDNKPIGGVGLLFMAFNADLGQQFEFVQKNWANGAGFPKVPPGAQSPGLDLVIGQGHRPLIDCPAIAGNAGSMKTVDPLPQAVTMRGGEYFFMPSLPFLRSLGGA